MKLVISLSFGDVTYAPGTVLGQYLVRLFNVAGGTVGLPRWMDAPLPPTVEYDVEPGNYTLRVERLSASGSPLAPAFTKAVTAVAPPPVVAPMVTDATFTVS
jgi:hypothetical protein